MTMKIGEDEEMLAARPSFPLSGYQLRRQIDKELKWICSHHRRTNRNWRETEEKRWRIEKEESKSAITARQIEAEERKKRISGATYIPWIINRTKIDGNKQKIKVK